MVYLQTVHIPICAVNVSLYTSCCSSTLPLGSLMGFPTLYLGVNGAERRRLLAEVDAHVDWPVRVERVDAAGAGGAAASRPGGWVTRSA